MLTIYGRVANLVAKTVVNPEESAPMPPTKPTRIQNALREAQADGVLVYSGPVDGFKKFEVEILGESYVITADDAEEVADELKENHKLEQRTPWKVVDVSQDEALRLTYELHRADTGATLAIESGELRPWCSGYLAGHDAGRAKNTGVDGMTVRSDDNPTIEELLVRPPTNDLLRLHLLALMDTAGENGEPIGPTILSERCGGQPTRKTIASALRIGGFFSNDLGDKLIAALGHHWVISTSDGKEVRQVPEGDRHEAGSVALLRQIHTAHAAGTVRYVGPAEPNAAIAAAAKDSNLWIAVGKTTHTVPASDVSAWLRGVTAARK